MMGETIIYVVTSGAYSDYHIDGVFGTRESAEQYTKKHEGNYNPFTIEEYCLDSGITPDNQKRLRPYRVIMKRDGVIIQVHETEEGLLRTFLNNRYEAGTRYKVLDVDTWAKDEAHAIKIANERRAEWIALGKWEKGEE